MDKNEIFKKLNLIDKSINYINENCKLDFYNTGKVVHQKQMLFHKNTTHRNRWVFGGNRSGKTECGAVEVVWIARGIHPYRPNIKNSTGWVVSLSTQVQRDVAQSKILNYLNKDWIYDIVLLQGKKSALNTSVIDTIIIKNVFGGLSRISFKSCDQGREKFQGTSLDYVWFDEEPPLDIYMECKMRVIDKVGQIFGTMTPLKGLTWVYDHIYLNSYNDPQVWHTHIEWADNPFLDQKEIESISKSISKDELQTRRFGNFADCGGIVYSEFNQDVHVIEPFNVPLEWYDNISIDPGLRNPLSAHWYAVDFDDNVYVIAEHYESDKDIIYHSNKIIEICDRLHWHKGFNGKYQAIIDSAANQRTLASQKSVTQLFDENGIVVNPKVNKDMFSGIQRVKSYLKDANGNCKLFIFKNCTNMIREIKGYFWGNNDAPIKRDDHAMDELRYYIMSKQPATKKSYEKSIIQKDKEKLYRNLKQKRFNG